MDFRLEAFFVLPQYYAKEKAIALNADGAEIVLKTPDVAFKKGVVAAAETADARKRMTVRVAEYRCGTA